MDQQNRTRRIVVVGASGGVGSAIVERFEAQGDHIFAIDIKEPNQPFGDRVHFRKFDLTQDVEMPYIASWIGSEIQGIDILIHAAGLFFSDEEIEMNKKNLQAMWSVNYFSCVELTFQLLHLLRNGTDPLVIFISSADAIVATAGQDCEIGIMHDVQYAASKGALLTTTRALALKFAPHRIRVNAICPTIIRTTMCDSLLKLPGKEVELSKHIPLGRICEPSDVVDAVESLYRLRMTTAHALTLDGGYLCR